jgi:putative redox protein
MPLGEKDSVATIRFLMTEARQPDMILSLDWKGEERFHGVSRQASMTLDGTGEAGPSPVQALAFALGGCMGIDVADMIVKGRFALGGLTCDMKIFRAAEVPKKITGVELHFVVKGNVPDDRVERAIALSREKYCSVWHSLDPAIDFKTSFTVTA